MMKISSLSLVIAYFISYVYHTENYMCMQSEGLLPKEKEGGACQPSVVKTVVMLALVANVV
jgi:hypothetical protein